MRIKIITNIRKTTWKKCFTKNVWFFSRWIKATKDKMSVQMVWPLTGNWVQPETKPSSTQVLNLGQTSLFEVRVHNLTQYCPFRLTLMVNLWLQMKSECTQTIIMWGMGQTLICLMSKVHSPYLLGLFSQRK